MADPDGEYDYDGDPNNDPSEYTEHTRASVKSRTTRSHTRSHSQHRRRHRHRSKSQHRLRSSEDATTPSTSSSSKPRRKKQQPRDPNAPPRKKTSSNSSSNKMGDKPKSSRRLMETATSTRKLKYPNPPSDTAPAPPSRRSSDRASSRRMSETGSVVSTRSQSRRSSRASEVAGSPSVVSSTSERKSRDKRRASETSSSLPRGSQMERSRSVRRSLTGSSTEKVSRSRSSRRLVSSKTEGNSGGDYSAEEPPSRQRGLSQPPPTSRIRRAREWNTDLTQDRDRRRDYDPALASQVLQNATTTTASPRRSSSGGGGGSNISRPTLDARTNSQERLRDFFQKKKPSADARAKDEVSRGAYTTMTKKKKKPSSSRSTPRSPHRQATSRKLRQHRQGSKRNMDGLGNFLSGTASSEKRDLETQSAFVGSPASKPKRDLPRTREEWIAHLQRSALGAPDAKPATGTTKTSTATMTTLSSGNNKYTSTPQRRKRTVGAAPGREGSKHSARNSRKLPSLQEPVEPSVEDRLEPTSSDAQVQPDETTQKPQREPLLNRLDAMFPPSDPPVTTHSGEVSLSLSEALGSKPQQHTEANKSKAAPALPPEQQREPPSSMPERSAPSRTISGDVSLTLSQALGTTTTTKPQQRKLPPHRDNRPTAASTQPKQRQEQQEPPSTAEPPSDDEETKELNVTAQEDASLSASFSPPAVQEQQPTAEATGEAIEEDATATEGSREEGGEDTVNEGEDNNEEDDDEEEADENDAKKKKKSLAGRLTKFASRWNLMSSKGSSKGAAKEEQNQETSNKEEQVEESLLVPNQSTDKLTNSLQGANEKEVETTEDPERAAEEGSDEDSEKSLSFSVALGISSLAAPKTAATELNDPPTNRETNSSIEDPPTADRKVINAKEAEATGVEKVSSQEQVGLLAGRTIEAAATVEEQVPDWKSRARARRGPATGIPDISIDMDEISIGSGSEDEEKGRREENVADDEGQVLASVKTKEHHIGVEDDGEVKPDSDSDESIGLIHEIEGTDAANNTVVDNSEDSVGDLYVDDGAKDMNEQVNTSASQPREKKDSPMTLDVGIADETEDNEPKAGAVSRFMGTNASAVVIRKTEGSADREPAATPFERVASARVISVHKVADPNGSEILETYEVRRDPDLKSDEPEPEGGTMRETEQGSQTNDLKEIGQCLVRDTDESLKEPDFKEIGKCLVRNADEPLRDEDPDQEENMAVALVASPRKSRGKRMGSSSKKSLASDQRLKSPKSQHISNSSSNEEGRSPSRRHERSRHQRPLKKGSPANRKRSSRARGSERQGRGSGRGVRRGRGGVGRTSSGLSVISRSSWRPPALQKPEPTPPPPLTKAAPEEPVLLSDRRSQLQKKKSIRRPKGRSSNGDHSKRGSSRRLEPPVDYNEEDVFSTYSWSLIRQDFNQVQKERLRLKDSIRNTALFRAFQAIEAEA